MQKKLFKPGSQKVIRVNSHVCNKMADTMFTMYRGVGHDPRMMPFLHFSPLLASWLAMNSISSYEATSTTRSIASNNPSAAVKESPKHHNYGKGSPSGCGQKQVGMV